MPFDIHGNRSFTVVSVSRNAPRVSGVYGLADARGWLYIGTADDIQAELLRHLREPDEFLRAHPPSGFTYELSAAPGRVARQNELVEELEPTGNRRAGPAGRRTSRL